MRSVGMWFVLALALVVLPISTANAACAVGADCVPPQYTAWCHVRGDDGAGNLPPYTCSAAQSSQLGFFNYADDTDWSIRTFKNVYGFVSGVATPAAPENLSYNVWPEPVGRHQQWNYAMQAADGSTTVYQSANGGNRWGYCPLGFELNVSGQCERPRPTLSPKNLGCCASPLGGFLGNPINAGVGNKVQTESDYSGSGPFPLEFVRTYNSLYSPYVSSFYGYWVGNYDRAILPGSGPDDVIATRRDGKAYFFTLVADVGASDADVTDRLYRLRDGSGNVSGWKYVGANDEVELYDVGGKLISITNRDGLTQSLIYSDQNTPAAIAAYPNKLIAVTDATGRSLRIAYDADNRVVKVTDPAGGIIRYTYDARGNLSTRVDADGKTRTYLYNETGLSGNRYLFHALTGIVGEDGVRYASYSYDYYGNATSTEHAGGVDKVSITYNGGGSVTAVDANGASRDYTFAQLFQVPRLTSVQEPCPACAGGVGTRSMSMDANGFANVITDTAGVTTDFDHNARGLETRRIDSANHAPTKRTVETDWHATLRVPLERRTYNSANVLVGKSTWTYNTRGQPLTSTSIDPATPANTRTSTTTYCEQADITAGTCPLLGLVTAVNGPRTDVNDTTTYTYYPSDDVSCASAPATCPHRKGDLWKVTNALGQVVETLAYDGAGRPRSVKDANGVVTDLEYHPRGWLSASKVRGANAGSETDDAITRYAYTPTGLVSQITQPDGAYTVFGYDAAHRLTSITDNAGNQIVYTLDNAGSRTKEDTKDSGGALKRTLSRVYNQLGQLKTGKDAYNHATGYVYDAAGNLDTTTDAQGTVTDNAYDPLGRLTQTLQDTAGINASTQFQYDALDRLTKVTDPKGLHTQYQYNGLGDLTQLTSPDTGVTTYSYDAAGNRTGQTDARAVASGYQYDALNRLTAVTYPTASLNVAYSYDTAQASCTTGETYTQGRLTRMSDASGQTDYCYDRFGNLVRKTTAFSTGTTLATRYSYALGGALTGIVYPDGTAVDYQRDAQGRIKEVGYTPLGGARQRLVHNVQYAAFGPVTAWTYDNGRVLQRLYDQNYAPTRVADTSGSGLYVDFTLDNVSRISELRNRANVLDARYRYDALSRLDQLQDGPSGTPIETYTYDATGNRTGKTTSAGTAAYTYPSTSHRLSTVGGVARTYSDNGNTTSVGGTALQLSYDDSNRLVQTQVNNVAVMNYAYNGRGEQVRRYLGSASKLSVYDEAGQWLGEYDGSTPLQQVIWLDNYPVGLLVGAGATQKLHYIQPDHLGTPREVIDPQRNVSVWKWQLKGEAFGASPPEQDPDLDGTSFVFDLRYPGQRYDAASGLNYNYFRDYEGGTGRYAQSDPIGLNGGLHTYAYVGGLPLQRLDSYGLQQRAPSTSPNWGPSTPRLPASPPIERIAPPGGSPSNSPSTGYARALATACAANPLLCAAAICAIPGNVGQPTRNCSDDPLQERDECQRDDGCKKATQWQIRSAGITSEHEFKTEYGGVPNSRFDICACADGSIVIKAQGRCGLPGAMIPTFERWK